MPSARSGPGAAAPPSPPAFTVLVTRPAGQAADWVAKLQAAGVAAAALPLIGIHPAPEPALVAAAWHDLGAAAAQGRQPLAVFVSPNAVEQFFAAIAPADAAWPPGARAGATGPGTVAALRAAGVPAAAIVAPAADAPQFDSEALWQALSHEDFAARPVWIVRGNGGRDWLATRLQAAGAVLQYVQAYRRAAPAWSAEEAARLAGARARPASVRWLFSSSEAITHLVEQAPGQDWSAARALASHPRIAAQARAAGFGRVDEIGATLDAVVAAVVAGARGD